MSSVALTLGFVAFGLLLIAAICTWAERFLEKKCGGKGPWVSRIHTATRFIVIGDVIVAGLALWAGIEVEKESEREIKRLTVEGVKLAKEHDRLSARLQPRTITAEQKTSLLVSLREIGAHSIVLVAPNADNESSQYKNEVRDLFLDAGWDATDGPFVLRDGGIFGIAAVVHSESSGPSWGGRLQKAFEEVGIKLDGRIGSKIPDGELQIWVGQNPMTAPEKIMQNKAME